MSILKLKFEETIKEVRSLNEKSQLIQEQFRESTCELSECFKWMLSSELNYGTKHCCLTVSTCPELYAKELEGIGFKVDEMRNGANTLCGYDVSW
jgi:hypothetical protein